MVPSNINIAIIFDGMKSIPFSSAVVWIAIRLFYLVLCLAGPLAVAGLEERREESSRTHQP